jgi:hypothetical protein
MPLIPEIVDHQYAAPAQRVEQKKLDCSKETAGSSKEKSRPEMRDMGVQANPHTSSRSTATGSLMFLSPRTSTIFPKWQSKHFKMVRKCVALIVVIIVLVVVCGFGALNISELGIFLIIALGKIWEITKIKPFMCFYFFHRNKNRRLYILYSCKQNVAMPYV